MAHRTANTAAALPDQGQQGQDEAQTQDQGSAQDSGDESDPKGTTATSDVPVLSVTAPPSAPPPQVIVQMVTPQAGEATDGLNEIRPGGEYIIQEPDGMGGTTKKLVNAEGQEIKGK